MGFEPMVLVLQTSALDHLATGSIIYYYGKTIFSFVASSHVLFLATDLRVNHSMQSYLLLIALLFLTHQ